MTTHVSVRDVLHRVLPRVLMCALTVVPLAALAQAAKQPKKDFLVLAINEGATTQTTVAELVERYTGLAKIVERTLEHPVKLEVYPEITRFRAEVDRGRFDVIFGDTVNVLAQTVRDKGFQAVAKTKSPYVAAFITMKGSLVQTPEDMRGKTIMMPERVFTTSLGHATLRDIGIKENEVTIRYTRLQESVAHAVELGMADVGVVNPAVKRQWESHGNPVLLETKPVPNWSVVVAKRFSPADVEHLRSALIGLKDSSDGLQTLKAMSVPEFVPATNAEYLELLTFIAE